MAFTLDPQGLAAELSGHGVAIFLFHGVAPYRDYGVRNYTGKHMPHDLFAEMMLDLRRAGHAASLDEVHAHVTGQASCPPRSFAVTFDDGFWNNLVYAAPVLEDLMIPATFFLTTDFVDHNLMSWADKIEAAVAGTSLSEVSPPRPLAGTHSLADTESRIRFLTYVRTSVKMNATVDPEVYADQLVDELLPRHGDDPKKVEILDRKLSWSDARQLASSDLFTLGGHGKTHRILSHLGADLEAWEVSETLKRLRVECPGSDRHFSVPEGFRGSYSQSTIECLQREGVDSSVTTVRGTNQVGTQKLELKRFFVA